METKIITVYDRATELGVLLTRITPNDSEDMPILKKAGYFDGDYIFYAPLDGINKGLIYTDPFDWNDRTHQTAHLYIINNWDIVNESVDVEKILGENKKSNEHIILEDPDFSEDLRNDIQLFIKANGFKDTRFYTRSEWLEREDEVGVNSYGTMTFEGELNHILNLYNGPIEYARFATKLNAIFAKYGLYFELGYSWSLHLYKVN